MSMWEPFTKDARQAIVLARTAARDKGFKFIGNQHLLLGLMSVPEGVAHQVLVAAGVSPEKLQHAADAAVSAVAKTTEEMEFTTDAKHTIEEAFAAAFRLHHKVIGSGHLLVGLLADTAIAAQIFDALAIDRETLKKDTIARLQQI